MSCIDGMGMNLSSEVGRSVYFTFSGQDHFCGSIG